MAINVERFQFEQGDPMLPLAALAHLLPAPVTEPSQRPLQSNPALGHVSLAIISLIYVLLSVWQS